MTRSPVPSAPRFTAELYPCNQPSPGRPRQQRHDTLTRCLQLHASRQSSIHVASLLLEDHAINVMTRSPVPSAPRFTAELYPCSQPSPGRPLQQAFRSQLADVRLVHLFRELTIAGIASLVTSLSAVTRSTSCPSFTEVTSPFSSPRPLTRFLLEGFTDW